MAKRRKKGGGAGRFIILVFIIGVIVSISLLFRKEIVEAFRPFLERLDLVRERREVVLFFSDFDGDYLIREKRKIEKRDKLEEEAKEVIDELIRGSRKELIPTLPPRTKCLSVRINGKGIAAVNFNQSLLKDHPGGSSAEILTVYSIVHSLTQNFPRIKKVQILIEGRPVETIAGHLSLKQPIAPKLDLIKKQGTP